eukprot:12649045-Alexandrium_andersonii.AAC.1
MWRDRSASTEKRADQVLPRGWGSLDRARMASLPVVGPWVLGGAHSRRTVPRAAGSGSARSWRTA